MSERSIETVRENSFNAKSVIDGLNEYYEDKQTFIRVYRDFGQGPIYLDAGLWVSALIEWLRVDHDIFYRPGLIFDQVEAARNAAKMCGLRAHIKDELDKRDLWFDKNADIPELVDTLFKAYDGIDAVELLRKQETEIRNAKLETRKAVNEQLKNDTDYVVNTLCDILEALGISRSDTVHLDVAGLKTRAIQRASVIKSEHDRYLEQLDKATADYQALDKENRELKNSQKSDTNKLIRDCCLRYNIVAPSRYLSDEASVEYVFSLLDSYSKQRNEAYADRDRVTAILQDLYRDIFHKDCTQFTYEDIATEILDKVLGLQILEDYKLLQRGEDVQKKAQKECYDYLWNALKKLSPECDALKITDYEKLVDRIFYEMSFVSDNCKRCQRKNTNEKFNYIRRTNKAEEELKELKEKYDRLVDRDVYTNNRLNQIVNAGVETQMDRKKLLDRLEERLKVREERITELTTALDISKRESVSRDDVITKLKELLNEINEEEDEG